MKEIGLPKGPRLRVLGRAEKRRGRRCEGPGGGVGDAAVQSVHGATHADGAETVRTLVDVLAVRASTVRACPVCRRNIEETIRWFPRDDREATRRVVSTEEGKRRRAEAPESLPFHGTIQPEAHDDAPRGS